jgi:hypothetical protein
MGYGKMKNSYVRFAERYAPYVMRAATDAYRSYTRPRVSSESAPARIRGSQRGRYVKNIGRLKKPRGNACRKYGIEQAFEVPATCTDPDIVTAAFGTAVRRQFFAAVAAIYRKLIEKAGYAIGDWEDVVPFNTAEHTMEFAYKLSSTDDNLLSHSYVMPVGNHLTQVDTLVQQLFGIATAPVGYPENSLFLWYNLEVHPTANTSIKTCEAKIDIASYLLHIKDYYNCLIQNRTPGAAATDDNAEDITNNPLTFRMWQANGNGVRCRLNNDTATIREDVVVGEMNGLWNGVGASGTAGGGAIKKIAQGSAFSNAWGTKKGVLQPGEIKKFFTSFSKTINARSYFWLLSKYMYSNDATSQANNNHKTFSKFGSSCLIQFEKLCRTGLGSQNIIIGFEVNGTYGAYCSKAPRRETRRINQVF